MLHPLYIDFRAVSMGMWICDVIVLGGKVMRRDLVCVVSTVGNAAALSWREKER